MLKNKELANFEDWYMDNIDDLKHEFIDDHEDFYSVWLEARYGDYLERKGLINNEEGF